MNILFICRLYWPHRGGVEKHVERLAAELMKRGHTITIITEQFESELPLEETHKGVKVVRLPYFALRSKRAVWTWIERQLAYVDCADVVHIHDVWWWYVPILVLRPLKRFYVTNHGYEGIDPPKRKAVLLRKMGEKLSSGTICIGDFMRKWYLAAPIIVSYGAADAVLGKPMRAKSALFLGRFEYDTGFDMYWEAASTIPGLSVDYYGEGTLGKASFIKKSKRLVLKPWIDRPEIMYQKYRYAFVSRYLAIVEAMQAKRLVIAVYNNEIKRDYLMCHPMRDSMVVAGSVKEMKDKMLAIMKDSELEQRMIDRAYEWAREQTWGKMADDYERLWR
jgi:glycosyltransferase involved in cell wall biosynthesis